MAENIDNSIKLCGRLGRDPELTEKQGKNGPFKAVTFSIAVDRAFGDDTDWFKCEMLGKRAEVIEKYFHKGDMIRISGSMESYKHEDRTFWTVKMSDFGFCGGKNSEHDEPNPKDSFEDINEDVPF